MTRASAPEDAPIPAEMIYGVEIVSPGDPAVWLICEPRTLGQSIASALYSTWEAIVQILLLTGAGMAFTLPLWWR